MSEINGNHNEPFYFTSLPNGWTVGRFRALAQTAYVVHAVTTRQGPDIDAAARDASAPAFQIAEALDLREIAFCRQAHGSAVHAVERGGPVGEADGLITNTSLLGLMGYGADCPLILAADPVSGAVGMAHASWRGTVGQIAPELILQLAVRYGAKPGDVTACICPSAGVCCYEVGPEVRQAAVDGIGEHAGGFFQQRDGKLYFDLWAANADQLVCAGVRGDHVHVAGVCTICRSDLFPSWRTDGAGAGRFIAVIGRK